MKSVIALSLMISSSFMYSAQKSLMRCIDSDDHITFEHSIESCGRNTKSKILRYAIEAKKFDFAFTALQAGANVNGRYDMCDPRRWKAFTFYTLPLYHALNKIHLPLVKRIIESSSFITDPACNIAHEKNSFTYLEYALFRMTDQAEANNTKFFQQVGYLLLDKGACPNNVCDETLWALIDQNQRGIVAKMLLKGMNVDRLLKQKPLLWHALNSSDAEQVIAQLFLSYGANAHDTFENANTYLHMPCAPGVIMYLHQKGLNINGINMLGQSPIECQVRADSINKLLDLGAKCDHLSIYNPVIIRDVVLLDRIHKMRGYSFLQATALDGTPLIMFAISQGVNRAVIEWLVKKGIDITDQRGYDGWNVLHLLCARENGLTMDERRDLLLYFHKLGVEPIVDRKRCSPLMSRRAFDLVSTSPLKDDVIIQSYCPIEAEYYQKSPAFYQEMLYEFNNKGYTTGALEQTRMVIPDEAQRFWHAVAQHSSLDWME